VRRLKKGDKPDVLVLNETTWTVEFIAAQASGAERLPARWRHPEILAALNNETHTKCAYCEAIIADVSYPHVEHIYPKSKRADLVVHWENLTLACGVCNNGKLDYYEPAAPLLHPYEDDPEAALEFRGPAVYARLGDEVGARSVARLRLMRTPLVLERMKRLEALHGLLEDWLASSEPDKSFRASLVEEAIFEDQEFSAFLRAEARASGFPFS